MILEKALDTVTIGKGGAMQRLSQMVEVAIRRNPINFSKMSIEEILELHTLWLDYLLGRSDRLDGLRGDLSKRNLAGLNLEGKVLQGINLKGANLKGTNLSNADLCFADLQGADLTGAYLMGTHLYDANLNNAVLEGVILEPLSKHKVS
jgi:uncharacterized protein YjbI with pentapeptide repeats